MSIHGRDLSGEIHRGDMAIVEGLINLKKSIKRRIETPKGALFAHPEYGNPAWQLLSDEMSPEWAAQVVAAIRECLADEPRIKRLDINWELSPETRRARFSIEYVPIESQVTENLIWEVTRNG